ncbi:MAG: acyltransferase family protein [Otoolea sp.]
MKRYDSITAIKAISCLMVFLSHWNGAFASWGHASLDWLFLQSPLRMMTFGNLAVCIFLMLSGTLVSLKVYRGQPISWGSEMTKRYLRMAIPIFGTHVLVYLLFRLQLFRTGEAAALMGNAWLATFYSVPLSLWGVVKKSFLTSVFLGDSSYYGPLWMMNYIFFGTVFSIVLAESLRGMSRRGRVVTELLLFGVFLVLDSYYLCFLMGNVLAQLLLWLESEKASRGVLTAGSAVLLLGGWKLILESFVITFRLEARGVGGALKSASFWGMLGGFFFSWGFLFLWELWLGEERKLLLRPILWLGERSYSVFLVHWLVICTFSCGFYIRFLERPNWFYLGVNFFASMAVTFFCTELFYLIFEKGAFEWCWKRAKAFFLNKNNS